MKSSFFSVLQNYYVPQLMRAVSEQTIFVPKASHSEEEVNLLIDFVTYINYFLKDH